MKSLKISPRCKPRVLLFLFCACIQPSASALHSRSCGTDGRLSKPFKASSASSSQAFWSVCCWFLPSPLAPVGQYVSLNYFNRHCLGGSSSLVRVSRGTKQRQMPKPIPQEATRQIKRYHHNSLRTKALLPFLPPAKHTKNAGYCSCTHQWAGEKETVSR